MNRRHFLTTIMPGAIMATRTSAGNPDHDPFPRPKLIEPAPSHEWPDCDPPEDSNAACQDREHEPQRRTTRPKPDPKPQPKPHPEKPDEKDPKDKPKDPKGKKDKNHDPKGKPHDKPKDNASEHNGEGGNDGCGGKTRDGSKNSDKGNRK